MLGVWVSGCQSSVVTIAPINKYILSTLPVVFIEVPMQVMSKRNVLPTLKKYLLYIHSLHCICHSHPINTGISLAWASRRYQGQKDELASSWRQNSQPCVIKCSVSQTLSHLHTLTNTPADPPYTRTTIYRHVLALQGICPTHDCALAVLLLSQLKPYTKLRKTN